MLGNPNSDIEEENSSIETDAMDIDEPIHSDHIQSDDGNQSEQFAPVKMIVMDGIVMRDHHCAFDNCISELANA